MHRQQDLSQVGVRADLHLHSRASHDCRLAPARVLAAARAAGLTTIAITDHDSIDSQAEFSRLGPKYGVQVIPGVELTSAEGTHLLAYFVEQLPEALLPLHELIAWVCRHGGVSALPHPYRSDTGIIYNWQEKNLYTEKQVVEAFTAVDLIEGINFKSWLRGEERLADIAATYSKPLLASTDAHYDIEIGCAFTGFELPAGTLLTPEHLRSANRQLWTYPVARLPKNSSASGLPLANLEPPVDRVAALKRIVPARLVHSAGQALYAWQEYARRRTKVQKIRTVVTAAGKRHPHPVNEI